MQAKLKEGLGIIGNARKASIEGRFEQARKDFLAGITIFNEVYTKEKDEKKKKLLKEQIDRFFAEATENKKKLDKYNLLNAQKQKKKSLEKNLIKNKTETIPVHNIKQQPPKNIFKAELPKPEPFKEKKTIKNKQNKNGDNQILNLILETTGITFKNVVGMEDIKSILRQSIILPRKRPDIFCGIRAPPRGILFYGPPGNGKTYIVKALASESDCTLFNLSASTLVSKFVGDSEKLLRNTFKAAYDMAPSIIFIDEIDSILTSRSQEENEASRRLKTEFLIQLDGSTTNQQDKVVLIGATNLPNELDKAALRRFSKRIYIGMPEPETRKQLMKQILKQVTYKISDKQFDQIAKMLENYSCSDIKCLTTQVARLPLTEKSNIMELMIDKIRPVDKSDFIKIIKVTPPNLSSSEIEKYKMLK